MTADELRYCLFKQVSRMTGIQTDYGIIPLDFDGDYELYEAVQDAVTKVLAARLEALEKPE